MSSAEARPEEAGSLECRLRELAEAARAWVPCGRDRIPGEASRLLARLLDLERVTVRLHAREGDRAELAGRAETPELRPARVDAGTAGDEAASPARTWASGAEQHGELRSFSVSALAVPAGRWVSIEAASSRVSFPTRTERLLLEAAARRISQALESGGRSVEQPVSQGGVELAASLEEAPVAVFVLARDGTILRANRALLAMLGDCAGRPLADLCVDRDACTEVQARLALDEDPGDFELRFRAEDGSSRWVSIRCETYREDGRFVHARCFAWDITRYKAAEDPTWAVDERFASFMANLPGAAWIKDVEGRYVYANEYAQRIFRTPMEELRGRTDEEVFPPETARQFRENDREARESRRGIQVLEELEHADGLHESIVSKFPMFDTWGNVAYVGGVAFDITDQRRFERALHESEKRNRATFQNEAVGIAEADLDGRFLRANAAFCRLVGYSEEELLERRYQEITHPQDVAADLERYRRLAAGQIDSYTLEKRYIRKDGSTTWVGLHVSLVRDRHGRPAYGIALATDANDRKRAEELRAHLAALVESSEEAIIGKTLDGTITSWNRAAERLYGYGAGEMVGRSIARLVPPERGGELESILDRLRRGEVIPPFETRRRRKDGRIIDVSLTVSPILDAQGRVAGASAIARDITEWKRTRVALQESESLLRSFCENSPVLMGIVDLVGDDIRHVYDNPATARFFGVEVGGTAGRLASDLGAPPDAAAEWRERYLESRAIARPVQFEYSHIRAGRTTWLAATVSFIGVTAEGVSRFAYVAEDVSARKQAESRIRAEVEFRRAVEAAVPEGIAAIDEEGRQVYVNAAFCRMVGWEEQELLGAAPPYRYWPPEGVERIRSTVEETRRGSAPPEGWELRFQRKNGERFDVLVRVGRVQSPGLITGWLASVTDITRRKELDHALRSHMETLETLRRINLHIAGELELERLVQEVTDSGVRLTRAEFGAFFYNVVDERGRYYRLFSLSGVPRELFEKFEMPRSTPLFEPTFRGESVVRLEDVTKDPRFGKNPPYHGFPEGHLPVRSYLAAPVVSRSGEVLGGLFFGHSSPGVFRLEDEELVTGMAAQAAVAIDNAQLYQAVRAADQRKDEFLATLAHELRNPLAPIRNALQVLRIGKGDALAVEEAQRIMERQVEHIVRLVDDLLDVSRITRGKITLRKERVDLADVVASAVETSRPLINARGHELTVALPPYPVQFEADRTRMAQILSNLLHNAAKYTDPGGRITLAAACEEREVVLSVRDNGMGIPSELLPEIFDMFRQVHGAGTGGPGGLGIGLTLVKRLVELHGGSIEARSSGPGEGSEFVVRIPLAPGRLERSTEPSEPRVPSEARLARRKILVVDDNVDAAETLAALLRLLGHEVDVTHDGQAALEMARRRRPDLVLLDLGMPGLNGYEVARELRRDPGPGALRLVALTGWGQEEDRRRSRAAGFDHHLVKPVDIEELSALLDWPPRARPPRDPRG